MAETATENTEVSDQTELTSSPTQESAPEAGSDAALEAKVAEGLKAFNDDRDADSESRDDVDAPTVGAEVVGAEAGEEDGAGAPETVDKPAKAAPAKPAVGAPATIPAAYVRSLKAMEWTDEEIAAAGQNPSMLPVIEKLHSTRQKTTQEWAQIGRVRQEQANVSAGQQQGQGLQPMKPIDAAPLKAQYGEEGLIDSLVNPLNATIQQINAMLPAIQQMQQRSQTAELHALGQQVETFFGSSDVKPFKDLYGNPAEKTLEEKQTTARNKVLELANHLMIGSQAQGRPITLREALFAAHDSVSAGHRTASARQKLVGEVTKRSNGVSLRPTGKAPTPGSKPGNASGLEKKVQAGLSALFK